MGKKIPFYTLPKEWFAAMRPGTQTIQLYNVAPVNRLAEMRIVSNPSLLELQFRLDGRLVWSMYLTPPEYRP